MADNLSLQAWLNDILHATSKVQGFVAGLIRIPFVTRQESGQRRFLHSTSGGMFCSSSASQLCESRWSDEIASSTQTLNTI